MKFKILPIIVLIISLMACSSKVVEVKPNSEQISVTEKQFVSQCRSLGKVTSSITTKIGIYTRDIDTVEANLLQLAKNSAVTEGADTVVKGQSVQYGEREFELFKCR